LRVLALILAGLTLNSAWKNHISFHWVADYLTECLMEIDFFLAGRTMHLVKRASGEYVMNYIVAIFQWHDII
jgi:hypothetical protein